MAINLNEVWEELSEWDKELMNSFPTSSPKREDIPLSKTMKSEMMGEIMVKPRGYGKAYTAGTEYFSRREDRATADTIFTQPDTMMRQLTEFKTLEYLVIDWATIVGINPGRVKHYCGWVEAYGAPGKLMRELRYVLAVEDQVLIGETVPSHGMTKDELRSEISRLIQRVVRMIFTAGMNTLVKSLPPTDSYTRIDIDESSI